MLLVTACGRNAEPKRSIKEGIAMYYLFDISKSFKDEALPTSVKVANSIYNGFIDSNTPLGSTFPQYHMTSTIDKNSIKAKTPCNVTVKEPQAGAVFKKQPAKIPTMKPCFDAISKEPASMNTDIKGAIYHAGDIMSDNNLVGRGLIIFSDMENDPANTFQNKIPLDKVKGISVVILYTDTLAELGKLADDYAKKFEKILKEAGAKDVKAWNLSTIDVSGPDRIFEYLVDSFTKGLFINE